MRLTRAILERVTKGCRTEPEDWATHDLFALNSPGWG